MNIQEKLRNLQYKFLDPYLKNKDSLHREITTLFRNLLIQTSEPYYCTKCRRTHHRGKVYEKHKKPEYAIPDYPHMKSPKVASIELHQIVGIYYAKSGDYLEKLEKGEPLRLKREPDNPYDECAISVWHYKKRLGYLSRNENKELFKKMDHQVIDCYLGNPCTCNRLKRANIEVHTFNKHKFNAFVSGCLEILRQEPENENLFEQVTDNLRILGFRAKKVLEAGKQTKTTQKVLRKWEEIHTIFLPNQFLVGTKLSIIL